MSYDLHAKKALLDYVEAVKLSDSKISSEAFTTLAVYVVATIRAMGGDAVAKTTLRVLMELVADPVFSRDEWLKFNAAQKADEATKD